MSYPNSTHSQSKLPFREGQADSGRGPVPLSLLLEVEVFRVFPIFREEGEEVHREGYAPIAKVDKA